MLQRELAQPCVVLGCLEHPPVWADEEMDHQPHPERRILTAPTLTFAIAWATFGTARNAMTSDFGIVYPRIMK